MRRLARRISHVGAVQGLIFLTTFSLIAGGVIGILTYLASRSASLACITAILIFTCLAVPSFVLGPRRNARAVEGFISDLDASKTVDA